MKLSEIINFDGQGWPYGKLTERACELGGPVRFVNVVHWNGYESGYQSGQASMVLPMIGLSVVTAIIGAGAALLINAAAKKKIQTARKKVSGIREKSIKEIDLSDDEITILTDNMLDKNR